MNVITNRFLILLPEFSLIIWKKITGVSSNSESDCRERDKSSYLQSVCDEKWCCRNQLILSKSLIIYRQSLPERAKKEKTGRKDT